MKKIFGTFVMTLLITIAVLPALGNMNEIKDIEHTGVLSPTVEWMKTYGGDEFDHFHTVRQTDDGGYIAVGLTEESDEYFVWLLKVDSGGNEEWSVVNHDLNGTYLTNTDFWIMATDVMQTSDGGYIVTGISMVYVEDEDETGWGPSSFFWKTDDTGNTEWLKHYYSLEERIVYFYYNIIEVEDGFVGGGFSILHDENWIVIDIDGNIFKTDFSGDTVWMNNFDHYSEDYLSSVSQTSDGGYLLGGFVINDDSANNDLWMVKTDGTGNLQWEQIFEESGFEYTFGKGFCEANNGGYIMNGNTGTYGYGGVDNWIIKTDSSGNIEWHKTFGGSHNDYTWSMCNTNDGYLFGICYNYGFLGGNADDIWIIKTDNNGNAEWKIQIEESGKQITRCVSSTTDGGAIACAMTSAFGRPDSDGIIVKISSSDNQRPSKPTITEGPNKGKPDTEYTFSATASDPDGNSLQYRWDWGDGEYSDWLDTNQASYTWTTEDKFEIRVMVQDINGGESEWSEPFAFSTPKNKIIDKYTHIIQKLIEIFPFLKSLLD